MTNDGLGGTLVIQLHGNALQTDQVTARRQLLAPVAVRIRDARRARNLTWQAVARRAGLRPTTLRRVETGQQGMTAAAVGRIAMALGVDEEELYPGGRPDAFWARLGAEMRRHHHQIPMPSPPLRQIEAFLPLAA